MYSNNQIRIVQKIGPTASFLNGKDFSPDLKSPRAMQIEETIEVCHELFPKLGKRFYKQFLKSRSLIFPGLKSQLHPSGLIEIAFTETIEDVSAIAHEVGHANQGRWDRLYISSEIYPRLIQKKLDELTGDEDFSRDFFSDIEFDKKKFTKLFCRSNKGLNTDPLTFKYFTGSILAIPVSDAISNGQYDLENVADWHDFNSVEHMKGLKITPEKVLESVEKYLELQQL